MINLVPLEEAYQGICFGYQEPDEMCCSTITASVIYAELIEGWDKRWANGRHAGYRPFTFSNMRYNNAVFKPDESMRLGLVKFINGGMLRTQKKLCEAVVQLDIKD